MIDPASGRSTAVTATEAQLHPDRSPSPWSGPLPAPGISFRSLFAFSLARSAAETSPEPWRSRPFSDCSALIPPLATQTVFGQIVPEGDDEQAARR